MQLSSMQNQLILVTQAELQAIQEFRLQKAELKNLIHDIRERIRNGAGIEPGELSAWVTSSQRYYSTKAQMTCYFGAANAAAYYEQLPRNPVHSLYIGGQRNSRSSGGTDS